MYSALAVADAAYDAYKLSQLHYITLLKTLVVYALASGIDVFGHNFGHNCGHITPLIQLCLLSMLHVFCAYLIICSCSNSWTSKFDSRLQSSVNVAQSYDYVYILKFFFLLSLQSQDCSSNNN